VKWLFDIIRKLPGGGVSISWTWDMGKNSHDTMRRRFLPSLRLPWSSVASNTKGPPSVAAQNFTPERLLESSGMLASSVPKDQALNFPDTFPKATQQYRGRLKALGPFQSGSPKGVTVHYTASPDIGSTINELASKNLGYHLIITQDGTVHQCGELTHKMNHAGKALWNEQSPNSHHLAVAVVSWGWVKELAPGAYASWSGTTLPTDSCVRRRGKYWHMATALQEEALMEVLRWCHAQGISQNDICGHSECALPKGRKSDPGGVLELEMAGIRDLLTAAVS
jgi:hypothetical protein